MPAAPVTSVRGIAQPPHRLRSTAIIAEAAANRQRSHHFIVNNSLISYNFSNNVRKRPVSFDLLGRTSKNRFRFVETLLRLDGQVIAARRGGPFHVLDMVQRDTALDCELGVIRLFGAADIGTRGMIAGWSMPEEGHVWNDGLEAVYLLSVRPPIGRFGLIIMGEPYVTRARPIQELTLFGNGYRIASWRMTARIDTALTVALEPEWWFTRGTRTVMKLLFYLPNSARPKDLNDGQDGREIGFCFRSICLRQLPPG